VIDFCADVVNGTIKGFRMTARQKSGLEEYLQGIITIRKAMLESIEKAVTAAIENTGYLAVLEKEPETKEDRSSNLYELVHKAAEWTAAAEEPTMEAFLEELALRAGVDDMDASKECVKLMTIHNSKGLEFDAVYLAGLEEELFPHANSRGSEEAVEEERRLCYVGMTRARKYLYMSHAIQRYLWGTYRPMRPSRFLGEVPLKYTENAFPGYSSTSRLSTKKQVKSYDNFLSEPDEDKGIFRVGDSVLHRDFGLGEVINVSTCSLGLTYDVFFSKDNCKRTLVAKLAHLTRP
jgi:DNA helicase-2/ATP-dependent DNA helicase PcrA